MLIWPVMRESRAEAENQDQSAETISLREMATKFGHFLAPEGFIFKGISPGTKAVVEEAGYKNSQAFIEKLIEEDRAILAVDVLTVLGVIEKDPDKLAEALSIAKKTHEWPPPVEDEPEYDPTGRKNEQRKDLRFRHIALGFAIIGDRLEAYKTICEMNGGPSGHRIPVATRTKLQIETLADVVRIAPQDAHKDLIFGAETRSVSRRYMIN